MDHLKNLDSIIFDLDGTLWDSTATVALAWQAAALATDFVKEPVTQQAVRSITGLPYDVIYPKVFPYLDEAQISILKKLCAKEELAHLHNLGGYLYQDLEETLRYLKNKYRLFIVSNCQAGYIEAFLQYHQLQSYFQDFDCFGNAQQSKAHNIQAVIQRNQLKSAVYIGDTQGDFNAAQSSRLPFIFATYGFGQIEAEPDARINEISELRDLL